MKYSVDKETDSEFVKEFLKKYLALGFANLPKKEIDILVFSLMMKFGYIEGKDDYSRAKELMIEEKKVKRMILESSIRNEKDDTLPKSMKSLQEKIFEKKEIKLEFIDNKYVEFGIESSVERRDFLYAIKLMGYTYDSSLNPEKIKIPIHVFIAVFCKYDDQIFTNFKKLAKEKIKNDSEWEKSFKDALPLTDKIKNNLQYLPPVVELLGLLMA